VGGGAGTGERTSARSSPHEFVVHRRSKAQRRTVVIIVTAAFSPSRLLSSSYIFYFQPESLLSLAITSSHARAHALIHRYHSLNTRPSVPPRHSAGTSIRTCDLSRFEAWIGAVDRFHLAVAVRPWERRPSALVITLDVDARRSARQPRRAEATH